MKKIQLTQGMEALVDDSDYLWLNQWKWYAHKVKHTYYAKRKTRLANGSYKLISMHCTIMQPSDNEETDHRDLNGLNNQRHNLRNCTHRQNGMNQTPCGKSKYIGVSIDGKYIHAKIKVNGNLIHLGSFKTEKDAAKARDVASKKYFGEFANLNFKD